MASEQVNPYALKEAAFIGDKMLAKRPDVLDAMVHSGARLCIMAHNEFTTDLPEFKRMGDEPMRDFETFSGRDFWDEGRNGFVTRAAMIQVSPFLNKTLPVDKMGKVIQL